MAKGVQGQGCVCQTEATRTEKEQSAGLLLTPAMTPLARGRRRGGVGSRPDDAPYQPIFAVSWWPTSAGEMPHG